MQLRRYLLVLLTCLCVAVWMGAATPTHAAEPRTLTDPGELEAFLDGVMAMQLEEHDLPGAVVVVVKDDALFFAKGYGFADVEQRSPVDPERTLFRPGSVSKLFVWTAVMQLVEQGRLSLDEDVNQYLDFTIPATYAEPITLRHLLTHTPGFEDRGEGLFRLDAAQLLPLDQYLKQYLPARVFPPGELGAYSNYGTSLAAYIVERVSGLPFETYVERHLFEPLGMRQSTFRQPLPPALAPDMARGYNFASGAFHEGSFEFVQSYPAGSLSASATDLARFMIAHMNGGRYGDSQILQGATLRQMHERLFTHDARLDGMAHGFFETTMHGQRILSHGGDTILFHSGLFLIPEQKVGLFVSTNGAAGSGTGAAVLKAFLDRYYPVEELGAVVPPADFAQRIAPYLGDYTLARSNFTSFEKIISALAPISAALDPEGYLIVSIAGETTQYVEVEPGLLQDRYDPANKLAYRTDDEGRAYLLPSMPFAFIKTPWYGTLGFHGLLLVSTLVLVLGSLVGWGVAFLDGIGRREPRPRLARVARLVALLAALLWLGFIIGFVALFADVDPGFGVPRIFFEAPAHMSGVMALPLLVALLAAAMLVFTLLAWWRGFWRPVARLHYTLLTLALLVQVWVFSYWNMLL